jgi:thiamine biosynthesis protein ThiI
MALITGESVGQVASQTLEALNVTDDAANMLVIRPLIAFDKNDIVTIAKDINTYEISIQPFEDCCTLFVAKHPKTKPKLKDILDIESGYDNMKEMIKKAVTSREVIKL